MEGIIFKGKSISKNQWITSDSISIELGRVSLAKKRSGNFTSYAQIHKETLCRYSGLEDSKGNKIFEHDFYILNSQKYFIFFMNGCFTAGLTKEDSVPLSWEPWDLDEMQTSDFNKEIEIIGNIHD